MDWSTHLFQYCERGQSTLFWAEPLNAASNGAFFIAGIAAVVCLRETWFNVTGRNLVGALIVLLFTIGAGSFAFHTFANRWSELADQIPITLFVFGYLIYSLRSFLGLRWLSVVPIMAAFIVLSTYASSLSCAWPDPRVPSQIGDSTCLWGSIAYVPALGALWTIGSIMRLRSQPVASLVLAAAATFTGSLIIRTLDIPACHWTEFLGKSLGTHFAWHALNACTLFILIQATCHHEAHR